MRKWLFGLKTSSPSLQEQSRQITELKQQLVVAQFEIFCRQFELKLAQLDHYLTGIPEHLSGLQQQLTHLFHCENLSLGCVICYPFSHECFIYHEQTDRLSREDIGVIQQTLLNCAAYTRIEESPLLVPINQYEARLLFTERDIMVWRLHKVDRANGLNPALLHLVDQSLHNGLYAWVEQQQRVRTTLLQERREVAAELHDSIAQILSFLRLKSAQLNQQCKQNEQFESLSATTEELANYTHYAYQQTRELITASRLAYQELDFASALKKVVQEFEHQSGIVFELENKVPQFKITAKEAVQLLYIIRESLSNVVRHSHASIAQIRLEHLASGGLQISVMDNGRGIDLSQKRNDSFGLEIMHERAERIGAELKFAANSPRGTCVILKLEDHS